jgi:predicted nuclease of predicted toxin-antitoxin system
MKLLADAHISKLIITFLESLGHDVLKASRFPPKTSDLELLRTAAREQRIVLTSDKDFGELVFRIHEQSVGVILLRIDTPHETERMEAVRKFWPLIEQHAPGFFLVVSPKGLRRTPLP